jgi:hypothetical protein
MFAAKSRASAAAVHERTLCERGDSCGGRTCLCGSRQTAAADSDEPFLANIPADAQQSALQKLKALAEVRVRGECFAVFLL